MTIALKEPSYYLTYKPYGSSDGDLKVYYTNGVYMGDILRKEDGFYDWWPVHRGGYITSWILRELADKLDEMNKEWEETIEKDCSVSGHDWSLSPYATGEYIEYLCSKCGLSKTIGL